MKKRKLLSWLFVMIMAMALNILPMDAWAVATGGACGPSAVGADTGCTGAADYCLDASGKSSSSGGVAPFTCKPLNCTGASQPSCPTLTDQNGNPCKWSTSSNPAACVPEMSVILAVAFIGVALGMVMYFRRRKASNA